MIIVDDEDDDDGDGLDDGDQERKPGKQGV